MKWIDKFIDDLPNNKVGLDPYPIALRGINWVKFFTLYPTYKTKDRINSLFPIQVIREKIRISSSWQSPFGRCLFTFHRGVF